MPEKIRSIFTQQKTRLRQQGSAAKLTSVFMILISFTIVFFIFKDIFRFKKYLLKYNLFSLLINNLLLS